MKPVPLDIERLQFLQQEVATGDTSAFKQLFDAFADQLTRFSFSIVREKEAAIEIMDTVFVRLWTNRQQLPQIQNIKVYLYTAVKNASLNQLAAKAKLATTASFDNIDVAVEKGVQPDQILMSAESFRLITEAVEALPPRCKMVFKLIREDGLSYREVADILQISINTVDVQMVTAVKRISEKLSPHLDFISSRRLIKK